MVCFLKYDLAGSSTPFLAPGARMTVVNNTPSKPGCSYSLLLPIAYVITLCCAAPACGTSEDDKRYEGGWKAGKFSCKGVLSYANGHAIGNRQHMKEIHKKCIQVDTTTR